MFEQTLPSARSHKPQGSDQMSSRVSREPPERACLGLLRVAP